MVNGELGRGLEQKQGNPCDRHETAVEMMNGKGKTGVQDLTSE